MVDRWTATQTPPYVCMNRADIWVLGLWPNHSPLGNINFGTTGSDDMNFSPRVRLAEPRDGGCGVCGALEMLYEQRQQSSQCSRERQHILQVSCALWCFSPLPWKVWHGCRHQSPPNRALRWKVATNVEVYSIHLGSHPPPRRPSGPSSRSCWCSVTDMMLNGSTAACIAISYTTQPGWGYICQEMNLGAGWTLCHLGVPLHYTVKCLIDEAKLP